MNDCYIQIVLCSTNIIEHRIGVKVSDKKDGLLNGYRRGLS